MPNPPIPPKPDKKYCKKGSLENECNECTSELDCGNYGLLPSSCVSKAEA